MNTQSHQHLYSRLTAGRPYRRKELEGYSKAIDRDLKTLLEKGLLEKAAPGIYYKPLASKYGPQPAIPDQLVAAFLEDKNHLMLTPNEYNKLGLGLTQLYNHTVVYNQKRHCKCKLDGQQFEFKRPHKGFPKKLTPEYLLVDLLNNLSLLAEDSKRVKARVKKNINQFDKQQVIKLAEQYGKVATLKFLREAVQ